MEVEEVGTGLAVVGWSPCWVQGTSPREPRSRCRSGLQPSRHPLDGNLEESTLGWVEPNALLGGESSNQTVSWIFLSCFELFVWRTDSSFVLLAFHISVATVLALLCTLASCGD